MPLKEKDWKLIYTVPASTFLAQVKHLTQYAIFSTGIVFAVVVAMTWLFSVSLIRPVKRLTYAANEIAGGNLDYPVTNRTQDEIGRLMHSFETMRNKLKGSYEELKKFNIESLLMLARACEVRDEDTGSHVMRIIPNCNQLIIYDILYLPRWSLLGGVYEKTKSFAGWNC